MRSLYPPIYSSLLLALLSFAVIFTGCKKTGGEPTKPVEEPPAPTDVPTTGTRAELTKDSIYLYAKEVYLWNDVLPAYGVFNPRKYTQYGSDLNNYTKELFDITQYKINPQTGKPYEYDSTDDIFAKYSYITDAETHGSVGANRPTVSQVSLEGVGTDFGIIFSAVFISQTDFQVYVRYVNNGSPAYKNNIRRGDLIQEMNGRVLGKNFSGDQNFIEAAFDQSSVDLRGKKSDGTTFNLTLTKATYNSSPVFKDTVITSNSKKIGYVAFARFSNPNNAIGPLNQAFQKFATAGVKDLVVDLRYNGGGYVSTAEHLSNLIAPPALNGSVMFTEYYNTTLQTGKATILKNQPLLDGNGKSQYSNGKLVTYHDIDYSVSNNTTKFSKAGSLIDVEKVVFIVSGNTASASELVINVLKPYLDVQLVGTTTYGKPVGFFPITIDKYDVYYSMFETKNSKGEGGYFAGFTPTITGVADDVTRDFGDPAEAQFAAAINYLTTGSKIAKTSVATVSGVKTSIKASSVKEVGEDDSFKGMIKTGYKLKAGQ